MNKPEKKQRGFTLIELMVSLTLSTLVLGLAWKAWYGIFIVQNKERHLIEKRTLQNVYLPPIWKALEKEQLLFLSRDSALWKTKDGRLQTLKIDGDTLRWFFHPEFDEIRGDFSDEGPQIAMPYHRFSFDVRSKPQSDFDSRDRDGNGWLEFWELDENRDEQLDSIEVRKIDLLIWEFAEDLATPLQRSPLVLERL